jgi:hypothetical protein
MSTRSDRSSAAEPDLSVLAWKRAQVAGEAWLVTVPAACVAKVEESARVA